LGCDANTEMAPHPDVQHLIGPNAHGKTHDERSNYFLGLLLELGLCASNTFGTPDFNWSWTHEWYGNRCIKNQLDYMLVPPDMEHHSCVLYQLDCASDHKPVCCYVASPAPSPPPPARKRSLKGWQPRTACDAENFRNMMNELPENCTPQDIHLGFRKAVVKTPFTTLSQRSRKHNFSEPKHIIDPRIALHEPPTPLIGITSPKDCIVGDGSGFSGWQANAFNAALLPMEGLTEPDTNKFAGCVTTPVINTLTLRPGRLSSSRSGKGFLLLPLNRWSRRANDWLLSNQPHRLLASMGKRE
jgi:hypothetical protein